MAMMYTATRRHANAFPLSLAGRKLRFADSFRNAAGPRPAFAAIVAVVVVRLPESGS